MSEHAAQAEVEDKHLEDVTDSISEEVIEQASLEVAEDPAIESEPYGEVSEEEEGQAAFAGLRSALDRLRGATSARREAAVLRAEAEELSDQLAVAKSLLAEKDEQFLRGEELLRSALESVDEVRSLLEAEQSKAEAAEAEVARLPELAARRAQEGMASLGLEIEKLPAAEGESDEVDLTDRKAVEAEVTRLTEAGDHGQATALRTAALRIRLGA